MIGTKKSTTQNVSIAPKKKKITQFMHVSCCIDKKKTTSKHIRQHNVMIRILEITEYIQNSISVMVSSE